MSSSRAASPLLGAILMFILVIVLALTIAAFIVGLSP